MYSSDNIFNLLLSKKFEGVNMKSIQNKSSCEAVNRWGHDLYDASQENQDEFPRYSKQLFPRYFNLLKNYIKI